MASIARIKINFIINDSITIFEDQRPKYWKHFFPDESQTQEGSAGLYASDTAFDV